MGEVEIVVCWLLSVLVTGYCISGTDLIRQLNLLSHLERSRRSNFLSHQVSTLTPGQPRPSPGALQGGHWITKFQVTSMTRPINRSTSTLGIELRSASLGAAVLTTRPRRLSGKEGVGVWGRGGGGGE